MTIIIISLVTFVASILTLYSGFGLGTLLMPVMAIFFPVPIAIALTALVHLMNNLFKFLLLRKSINWSITLKFGFPALIAAIPGAWLLTYISYLPELMTYHFFHITATIEPVKLMAGILLIAMATIEWRNYHKNLFFNAKYLPIGGFVSGFFGGLSGQQGAFRTPFLLHVGLNKEQFVSTNAGIAIMVDGVRLIVYGLSFQHLLIYQLNANLLLAAIVAALLGAILGVMGLKKITFSLIQKLVAALLYFLGVLLLFGII